MNTPSNPKALSAELLLSSVALDEDLEFFRSLGFLLESIFPADNPSVLVLVGFGLRLRIERGEAHPPASLRIVLEGSDSREARVAPNGTRVEFAASEPSSQLPVLQSNFVHSRSSDTGAWITGRAGMLYRDLIPDRVGGHFIASHIRIPEGGPVPDYVHYHRVGVQIIYCLSGWVKVVYEDQGEPFVLQAGDCVSQPPGIRHRVLECSPGLEVLEVGSPADHETRADSGLELPNEGLNPEREFGGQVFLKNHLDSAEWVQGEHPGFLRRDTGLEVSTRGLARLIVQRATGEATPGVRMQPHGFCLWYVHHGNLDLRLEGATHELSGGDALVLPKGSEFEFLRCSPDSELIEFTYPG